jgi:ferritin-like metal-binding protein YciE
MATVTTMEDLFLDEIRDLYDAEKQLTKALPKMAKAAASDQLREAFEQHLTETQRQVERLEEIFGQLDKRAVGKKCPAMQGLIAEGEDVIKEMEDSSVRDAGLIAAAQKVEHYEMSGYGSACAHARILGYVAAVPLLEQTLNEEKETDRRLNELAENSINQEAVEEGESASQPSGSRAAAPKTRTAGGH